VCVALLHLSFIDRHLLSLSKRLNFLNASVIDLKGPLPSTSSQRYLSTVVHEYSRFPFAFPCFNVNAQSVIACLTQLFVLFGMPAYIHSDRGSAFLSQELITFLHERGVACSRTSAYNAPGNGQCERYKALFGLL